MDKSGLYRVINNLRNTITLEHCVIRFIMAWCFVSLVESFIMNSRRYMINSLSYVKNVDMVSVIICSLVLTIVLYVIFEKLQDNNRLKACILEGTLLTGVVLVYACVCVYEYNDVYFVAGMTLVVLAAVVYSYSYVHKIYKGYISDSTTYNADIKDISKRMYITGVAIVAGVMTAFISICMVFRYLSFGSPNFDMGLFSQMFHYMKTTGRMLNTSERDHLMSHMCVHISPMFYTILPFYMLVSSPVTLEVMQAVVIAIAVIPLCRLAECKGMSRRAVLIICIIYCFYPVMSGGCFYDIHENMFLPVLIFTFLLYMEKDNMTGILISAILICLVKEDAPVFLMFIALYMIIGKRMYKKGFIILILSIVYFVIACKIIEIIGTGIISDRFNNMIAEGNGNITGIIKTVINNPAYIITQIMDRSKIAYILKTLGVLLFIPLCTRKWSRFILLGPYIMFNLMSDYEYFHSIYFHYSFGSGALIIYLLIINICDMDVKKKMLMLRMTAMAVVIFFMAFNVSRLDNAFNYVDENNKRVIDTMNEGLSTIPDDASVTATTFLCASLSKHKILYELYYTDKQTEYIALDLRYSDTYYNVSSYLDSSQYETVYYAENVIAVFKNRATGN
jgi:uncharacterized membrane protein